MEVQHFSDWARQPLDLCPPLPAPVSAFGYQIRIARRTPPPPANHPPHPVPATARLTQPLIELINLLVH